MATLARSVGRTALVLSRRIPTRRKPVHSLNDLRWLSSTPRWRAEGAEDSPSSKPPPKNSIPPLVPEELKEDWEALTPEERAKDEATWAKIMDGSEPALRVPKVSRIPPPETFLEGGREAWEAMSPEDRAEFTRVLEEAQAKWDAMTPAEQDAFDTEITDEEAYGTAPVETEGTATSTPTERLPFPDFFAEEGRAQWDSLTPRQQAQTLRAHEEERKQWEAMTPEERAEAKRSYDERMIEEEPDEFEEAAFNGEEIEEKEEREEMERLPPERKAEALRAETFNPDVIFNLLKQDEEQIPEETKREFDAATPQERVEILNAVEEEMNEVAQNFDPKQAEREAEEDANRLDREIEREAPMSFTDVKPKNPGFWGEDEDDEFGQLEDDDDEYKDDEMTTIAHAHLDLHREMRHYARIAAWDMPLLSNLAKPFTPPALSQPLRFRYTTYMGESHPAAKKVTLSICTRDLLTAESAAALTEPQRIKLLKLAGPRYNPSTDVLHLSCEKFETAAQNKRYLGDLLNKLVTEAKDPTDTFEDVPLDLRHHKTKPEPKFPEGWRLSARRKAELEQDREERRQRDIERQERHLLVDGREELRAHMAVLVEKNQVKAAEVRARPLPSTFGRNIGGHKITSRPKQNR